MKEWKKYFRLTAKLCLAILRTRLEDSISSLAIEFSIFKNTLPQISGIMWTPSQTLLIMPLKVSTLEDFRNQVGLLDQLFCGRISPVGPLMKLTESSRCLKVILKSRAKLP